MEDMGLVWVYFTTFGGFIALTAWLPTYWHSYFGVSAVKAGLLTAVYSVLTSAIRIGGGMFPTASAKVAKTPPSSPC